MKEFVVVLLFNSLSAKHSLSCKTACSHAFPRGYSGTLCVLQPSTFPWAASHVPILNPPWLLQGAVSLVVSQNWVWWR